MSSELPEQDPQPLTEGDSLSDVLGSPGTRSRQQATSEFTSALAQVPKPIVCPNCTNLVVPAPRCWRCGVDLNFDTQLSTASARMQATQISSMASSAAAERLADTREVEFEAQMDPRLQRIVTRSRKGILRMPTSSTASDEVAVIGKVRRAEDWQELSEVRAGVTMGGDDATGYIVTGRIPITRIEAVRNNPNVISLKAAQRIAPALQKTTEETRSAPNLLPPGSLSQKGKDVIVGIVDFGCDFAHRNFRASSGATRLLAIWNQGGQMDAASPFGYGKLYSPAEINAALNKTDPYLALGYGPRPDRPLSPPGSHGTHVMDIAAGNGRGSGVPGVAPAADIIFVEASVTDIPFSGAQAVGKSFGDSVQLLEAVKFIFDRAGDRPCVINVSLGTNGGPHDGTTLFEQGIDRLLQEKTNRAVVIAASNSFSDGIHTQGTVAQGEALDLSWRVPNEDATSNELEIWYSGEDRFAVELIGPSGTSMALVEPGQAKSVSVGVHLGLFVANRLGDPNNQDNVIGIFLEAGMATGDWTVRLIGREVHVGAFHAWIERDDNGQSSFGSGQIGDSTLGSISCGQLSIAVGSYDGHKLTKPLSFFSSAGPTRDGREKPEISAPGHNVVAAHSRTKTGVVRKSGTSMAAPAVTGIIALMLGEARRRNLSLSTGQISDILKSSARHDPPVAPGWHKQYGNGRVSAAAAVQAVMGLGAPAPIASVPAAAGTNRKQARPKAKAKRQGSR